MKLNVFNSGNDKCASCNQCPSLYHTILDISDIYHNPEILSLDINKCPHARDINECPHARGNIAKDLSFTDNIQAFISKLINKN